MKRAKILVVEGTDGSGKETQAKKLIEYYISKGLKVKMFSFPVYNSPSGKLVGGPFQGKEEICGQSYFIEGATHVDPFVSCLYYAADRRYNFLKEIENEIFKNDIIILDRYTTSNMGHQASKAKNDKELDKILKFIETLEFELLELPRPDIVIFLHMPTLISIELRSGRKCLDDPERDIEHLKKSENNYLKLYKKYNWEYINCSKVKNGKSIKDLKTIDEISNEIISIVDNKLSSCTNEINNMTRF